MSRSLPELEPLLGDWTTEATHPMLPSVVVHGRARFEWLNGDKFLVLHSATDHPQFPDSISIIGDADGLHMHYFDDRGVERIYDMALKQDAWELSRDAPGFSQRFTGTFEDGGNTIVGRWMLSEDDETWTEDLEITYQRRTS